MPGVSRGSFVGHIRQCLAEERPLPPGCDYRLVFEGRVLQDCERLPAFTFGAIVDAENALEQRVRELLDRLQPDNVQAIADALADVKPRDAIEIQQIVGVLTKRVMGDHHGTEMYARVAYLWSARCPAVTAGVEGNTVTFRRSLLTTCQKEFETSLASFDLFAEQTDGLAPEEILSEKTRRKSRLLAMLRFVGHLFVGNIKFFESISDDLIDRTQNFAGRMPEERAECVLEVLQIVGKKLSMRSDGLLLIHRLSMWLMDHQHFVSSGIQRRIQSLAGPDCISWGRDASREM